MSVLDLHLSGRNITPLESEHPTALTVILSVPSGDSWLDFASTETVLGNPNPVWVKFFRVTQTPSIVQPLRFVVVDATSPQRSISCETTVAHLVANASTEIVLPLQSDANCALVIQVGDLLPAAPSSTARLCGSLSVRNVRKVKTFSKPGPYYEIEKRLSSGAFVPIYRSMVMAKCYGATWPEFRIPIRDLGPDESSPIRVSFLDRKSLASLGTVTLSISEALATTGQPHILHDPKAKGKPIATFRTLNILPLPTAEQFHADGLPLNVVLAIDFTWSTPGVISPWSGLSSNPYETALWAVVDKLGRLTPDGMVALLGFGAPDPNVPCDVFLIDGTRPCVKGGGAVVQAYQQCLERRKLLCPSGVAPVINKATDIARDTFKTSGAFTVFAIVTAGRFYGIRQEKLAREIIAASESPLGIVTVIIGDGDFWALTQPIRPPIGPAKRDVASVLRFAGLQGEEAILQEALGTVVGGLIESYQDLHAAKPVQPKPGRLYFWDGASPHFRFSSRLITVFEWFIASEGRL